MTVSLSEYSPQGGAFCIGCNGSIEALPWSECHEFYTYVVYRDGICIAEFKGRSAELVREWLRNHPDYDGRAGDKAWKGECDFCGATFVTDCCGCEASRARLVNFGI